MNDTLVNGQPGTQISLLDRGLSYGDGVFETLLVEAGKPLLLRRHLARLYAGLDRLAIPYDQAFMDRLAAEIEQLCRGRQRAFLKLIITRGAGGRGYRALADLSPSRILRVSAAPDYPPHWYQEGCELYLCRTRLGLNPLLAGIKHLNRLEQVLARNEWQDQYPEGLVCDIHDRLIEGTMSNLFLLRGQQLLTPLLDQCGVAGIVRSVIIDWARLNEIEVIEQALRVEDLFEAEAVFLTNTGFGVLPVRSCGGGSIAFSSRVDAISQWLNEARLCES
ncbi:MAG: 4-amino-4-deoxychorismate lyase [Motiliproteus sp.]|jgi:4-amino-4-deoxychorismate lyase